MTAKKTSPATASAPKATVKKAAPKVAKAKVAKVVTTTDKPKRVRKPKSVDELVAAVGIDAVLEVLAAEPKPLLEVTVVNHRVACSNGLLAELRKDAKSEPVNAFQAGLDAARDKWAADDKARADKTRATKPVHTAPVTSIKDALAIAQPSAQGQELLAQTTAAQAVKAQVLDALADQEMVNAGKPVAILEDNQAYIASVIESLSANQRGRLAYAGKQHQFEMKSNRILFWTEMHKHKPAHV